MKRVLCVFLAIALGACPKPKTEDDKAKPKDSDHADAHVDEKEHEGLPKRVHLKQEVITAAKIATAKVVREKLAVTLSVPGEISADPDRSARISAPVAGRLTDVRFKEGDAIKKGDLLAVIRVPEIGKVRAAYNATSARAVAARSNASRLSALADKGLGAKQDAVAAGAEAEGLEAESKALQEQLSVLGMGAAGSGSDLTLRSPVTGTVIMRDAVVGQPVTAEQAIGSIADLSELWFLGRVFEKDLGRVRVGAAADVTLNAYPKQRFPGSVEYLSKQIDATSRTITARIRLTNQGDLLRIGLFGTAHVATGEEEDKLRLTVPASAVTEIAGKSVVFVRHPDDDFELHDVVAGESALGKVEIVRGLREGEDVVSQGVFTLKSAVLKSTLAEDD